jgi:hypothetical protein
MDQIVNKTKKLLTTYSSMYFPKKREHFSSDSDFFYNIIMTLIAWIVFGFAIYLSFRCNEGFTVWGFLGAFFFAPIYVVYKLTSTPKMCGFINK